MFTSGSNSRITADIKDIMATGKRSQVFRLVCEPLLIGNTLIDYLQNFGKRFSSGSIC